MSKPDRLKVVRLLIKALQQDEIDATQRAQGHKRRADEATQRKQRVEWLRDDVARNLKEIFGDDGGEEAAPEFWSSKARAAASAEKLRADPQIEKKLTEARELVETKDGDRYASIPIYCHNDNGPADETGWQSMADSRTQQRTERPAPVPARFVILWSQL